MEERRLGPVVGLGTWRTFDGDAELARRIVDAAVAGGCHVVDTSPMYGAAEASLASALADALRARGVEDSTATLTAEAGIAVFRVAFERWINENETRDLAAIIRTSLEELKAITRA